MGFCWLEVFANLVAEVVVEEKEVFTEKEEEEDCDCKSEYRICPSRCPSEGLQKCILLEPVLNANNGCIKFSSMFSP
jgi:hypothetical protein